MVKVADLRLDEPSDAEKDWLEHHVESMLAYDDAYDDLQISQAAFVCAIRTHLRKLRRAQPMMDS